MAKKKGFGSIYAALEEVDGETVLFSCKGASSVILEIVNPVRQYCTDSEQYVLFHNLLSNILSTIGEGYIFQKQDIFSSQSFQKTADAGADFLTRSYFRYFNGRRYTKIQTYIIITQEYVSGNFVKYDEQKWNDFLTRIKKVVALFNDKGIPCRRLSKSEVNEYVHRYMAVDFSEGPISMSNFLVSDEYLKIGDRCISSYQLVDIDEISLPVLLAPYVEHRVNGYPVSTDVLSFIPSIPHADCIIYNQVIQIPAQRKLQRALEGKAKRHHSLPGANNKIAEADILAVLQQLTADTELLVKTNFNIMVSSPADKVTDVASYIEAKLYECGIMPSKTAYNQLELFRSSFPGNGYDLNQEYDLFLTLSSTALCLCFKERLRVNEDTPLKVYYTDRQGLPICIDITGKEGKDKMTDNANFFCIGPSGSGKSFHMNSVVRQLLEQGTDVVMVDTGDSYEGICGYFGGTYISYSKEHPISMNPFKITDIEYNENFGEKKNFLKSLIFLIFKGNEAPTKIEDLIINQIIVEYYEAYFNPFKKFSASEKKALRKKLLTTAKMNGEYHDEGRMKVREEHTVFNHEDNTPMLLSERRAMIERRSLALQSMIDDKAATAAEKLEARKLLRKYNKEMLELEDEKFNEHIELQIARIEKERKRMKVSQLNFNTFYEYAIERIPQITREDKTSFDIHNFAAILKPFYLGGEQEMTLNSDLDVNLFDERFIVFEIDKIKDDPVIFPIVVLIIMDVFLQKMRIKKGRKALIIEEAWKAIASPTMAEYIKYLYKTVRKFHGIAGVVTQELNDVIDSPIVKEAIINNSDIKILLDQAKFKDRYNDISAILGLTDVQKQQIFTVNALNNKEGRAYFKEVWICRGANSDVYGVEEPPECYWAYTTERAEKEALKIYTRYYGNIRDAIMNIEKDRNSLKIGRYLDFANKVNQHKTVMALWENE